MRLSRKHQQLIFQSTSQLLKKQINSKNKPLGKLCLIRAFFNFRLAKLFGGVPLINSLDADRTVGRSSYTETFAQIATDLKAAIESLPATPFPSIPTESYGQLANKWVASLYGACVLVFIPVT